MSGFPVLAAATVTGAFVFGMVLALLGSVKLALAKRLEIGEARVGGLLSALHFALIPMMPLSGILLDRFGVRAVLVAGCVVAALGLYGLTVRQGYAWAAAAIVLTGVGAACVSTSCVVLMPRAFFDGDPDKVTAAVNLGSVFLALGSLVTPTLADVLTRLTDLTRALAALAVLCLLPALMLAFGAGAGAAGDFRMGGQTSNLREVLADPRLWLAGLVFFLYAPLEFTVSTWATTYLTDIGVKERRAPWLLSGFWMTFLAARLLMAYVQDRDWVRPGREFWVILGLSLAAAVVIGNLAGAAGGGRAALGLLLLGAVLGPIFPTLVGIVFREFPYQHGTAYGAMYGIGSLGSLLLGPLIGLYARGRTVQQALRIPMLLGLVMMAVTLVLGLLQ